MSKSAPMRERKRLGLVFRIGLKGACCASIGYGKVWQLGSTDDGDFMYLFLYLFLKQMPGVFTADANIHQFIISPLI